jgi:hypothetical protein
VDKEQVKTMRKLSFIFVVSCVALGCSSPEQTPDHIVASTAAVASDATAGVGSDVTAGAATVVAAVTVPGRRDVGMPELSDAAKDFAEKVAAFTFPEAATKAFPDGKVRVKIQRISNTTDGHLDPALLGDKIEDKLAATGKVVVFSSPDATEGWAYEVQGAVSNTTSTEGATVAKTVTIKLDLVAVSDKSSAVAWAKDYRFETTTPAPDHANAAAPAFAIDDLMEAVNGSDSDGVHYPGLKDKLVALAIPTNARVALSLKNDATFPFDAKAAEGKIKEAVTATGKAAVVAADDTSAPEKPYALEVRLANWRGDMDWVTVTIDMVDPADHSVLLCLSSSWEIEIK